MNNLSVAVVKPHSSTGYFDWKFMRFPPMGGPLIASFLKKKGYNATFIDLDYDNFNPTDYDIVLISMFTTEAPEGYKLADRCRKLGIPVIGGGYHVAFNAKEAKKHFDVVVKRDGIPIILKAISKAVRGKKGIMEGKTCSKERLNLSIDKKIMNKGRYADFNFIMSSSGCPYSCSFCTVWKRYGKRVFWKDIKVIENEIKNFEKGKIAFFLDDNLSFVNPSVFKLMKIYGYKFVGEASLDFIRSDKFKLAVDCGLIAVALGFETIQEEILKKFNKSQSIEYYDEVIKTVKDNNLALFGFFVLDPDIQTKNDMERIIDYAINKNFDFVQFTVLTPFPGTELRKKIKNRVFDNNWKNYTTLNCVFHPKKMGYKEVNKMVIHAHKKFYSIKSMIKRLFHTKRMGLFLAGNLISWYAARKEWGW